GCMRKALFVKDLLEYVGWIINLEKSILTPVVQMEFLGVMVDSKKMMFFVPAEKRTRFRKSCARILKKVSNSTIRLRTLAAVAGKLQSLSPCVPFTSLHLQALTQTIRSHTEGKDPGCV